MPEKTKAAEILMNIYIYGHNAATFLTAYSWFSFSWQLSQFYICPIFFQHLNLHILSSVKCPDKTTVDGVVLWPSIWTSCQVISQLFDCCVGYCLYIPHCTFFLIYCLWRVSSSWEQVNRKKIFCKLTCLHMPLFIASQPSG